MRYVWVTAVKDLRRRLRDPLALALWIGIPFAILALLSLAFGGGEVQPQARLLVVDQDDSLLSGFLAGALGQGTMAELILVETVDEEEGRRRIDAGDGSALLLIPDGFGQAVLESRPTELTLLTNPSQRILPGIVEEVLSLLVDAGFYLQLVAGEPLAEIVAGPPEGANVFSDETVAAMSVRFNQLVSGVIGYLSPPRLGVAVEIEEQPSRPTLSLGPLFFQSLLFLAVLFMAQGMSDDFWLEREQGTLGRCLTLPHKVRALLAGKLLAVLVLIGALAGLGVGIGGLFYGFAAARLPLAVLWAAGAGAGLWLLFSLLQMYATSRRAGSILSNLVLFPLMFLGGSFFPFEAMPEWLAAIGRWTPNGAALEVFKSLLAGQPSPARLAAGVAVMAVAVGGGYLLAARRLRRGFALS